MNTFRFIARNPTEALAQIQAQLGPEAVVLNVQPLPVPGMARLWQKGGKIEVIAGLPEETSPLQAAGVQASACTDNTRKRELQAAGLETDVQVHIWRSVAWLEAMGLLPIHAKQLQTYLQTIHGDAPPDSLDTEWALVCTALSHFWMNPPSLNDEAAPRPHVFIGPSGSGKTTALCKWLTLSVLMEERTARVWRLDGSTANTAEWLTLHCEMLDVPLERFWLENKAEGQKLNTKASQPSTLPLWFVDLPGVDISDVSGMAALQSQLALLPSPRVHLVLNAAYETSALLAQWRAFRTFTPEDLIFTHMDEEERRVKLWNFVLGTNCSVRFLTAGQKIPGDFLKASPEFLLPAKTC